jgi:ABC-type dipeptide/oligopeptide/nickel transport system permease subunit
MTPTNTTTTPPPDALPGAGQSLWHNAARKLMRDPGAMLCLAVILLYVLVALGVIVYEQLAAHYESVESFQNMTDYEHTNAPPSTKSWLTWLGTDWAGKSVLLKTILGTKVSITVGFLANIIAVPLGMILGALAGYYGGILDDLIVWLYTTLSCVPGIILLLALKYAFQDQTLLGVDLSGIYGICLALAVTSWIGTCRLVRAETLKLREADYVIASRAIGQPGPFILLRHILPNVMHLGIISFSLGFVGAIKAEVLLSYLGLGVKVGTPSWGAMINSARTDLFVGRWWELTSAVVAMFIIVLAWNIFGDRLRDALDPRLKNV